MAEPEPELRAMSSGALAPGFGSMPLLPPRR